LACCSTETGAVSGWDEREDLPITGGRHRGCAPVPRKKGSLIPVIKFDVSGSDPERATSGGEPPKPGIYVATIKELKEGIKKGEVGDEFKRLEVVYEIAKGTHKGYPLFDYLAYSEAAQWKLDQFLQAIAVASTTKRKGQFKTEDYIGTPVRVRIKGETYEGEYRPKVGFVMMAEDSDLDSVDDEAPEGADLSEDGGEPSTASASSQYLTREQIQEAIDNADEAQLVEWAEAFDIDHANVPTWEEVLEMILTAQAAPEPEPEPAKPAKAAAKKATAAAKAAPKAPAAEPAAPEDGYDDASLDELKQECKDRGLPFTGLKAALIKRLRENDSEAPF